MEGLARFELATFWFVAKCSDPVELQPLKNGLGGGIRTPVLVLPGHAPESARLRPDGGLGVTRTPNAWCFKPALYRWSYQAKNGGCDRIRTRYPLGANEVLSQLSYAPTKRVAGEI